MVILLILIIVMTAGYDLKCPARAEWKLRGTISCSAEDKYVCLFHLLDQKYMENCLGSDRSSIGSKLVFQPLFNLAECNVRRYQPIVFTTHGNSQCIYRKSKCAEEGQVIFNNDSSSRDVTCRCDYTQGYAFVTKPKNSCFCSPSEEDCSCYRSTCTKLSQDYQCITDGETLLNATCKEIIPYISNNTDGNAVQLIEISRTNYTNAQKVACIIITCLAVCSVFAVVVLFKVFLFDDVFPKTNKTTDDEKQKFLHELFLKGECGKLHFARLVFIGKHGVGKTSLMRRLLWQKKEDVTSTKSTDGIEVEKCNINIVDGKWSPCKETDDHVRRLIHQVFKGKILNVERKAMETINDQKHFSSNEDGPRSDSNKEPSTSFDESDTINIFNDDSKGESNASDDIEDIQTVISDNKDNHVMVKTGLNLMPPDSFKLENTYDSDINHLTKQSQSDPINDENINEMTSTIMKSYLQFKEKEQDDMLAFCWLWDFAGQKDFYATHQVFLSKHAVFLLVTDSLEFTTAENQGENFVSSAQYVSFWFDAIHCYWSTAFEGSLDPPIIVVCTNEDKFKKREREKRQTKFKENLNHVLKKQEKKGHLRNIYFISNTEDTDIVFEKIRKEISRQAMTMKDWGKDCPLKWLLFQRVLMKLKDNNVPISSTKALLKIAKHKDIDIKEDNEVKRCLQYCHEIGTIVYFDEKKLEDYVILDPKWLINAFRCLVSDKIENIIEVSDDWQTLTDTGQLTYSLISLLFRKEPELKFEENKAHLIEVMKRFDIIVNLKDSTELYMPCMVKSCSFSEVQKQFSDGSQSTQKTSWLCLEFKFLPPAFFNHIIAWYIKQYNLSVILDKQSRRKRNALYRQVGVFDLDPSGCEQLVVCEGPNIIALQVWDSRMSNKTYGDLGSDLFRFVKTLRKRYSVDIPYSNTFTCTDGDFTIHRKSIEDLLTRDYRCIEHNTNHLSDDLVKPWNFSEELKERRERESRYPFRQMAWLDEINKPYAIGRSLNEEWDIKLEEPAEG